jgi:hypothetical protein
MLSASITVNKNFLNKKTVIERQLIRTARKLEAECWQVCGEAWLRWQKEMSQILGLLGQLDFTMLGSVLAWRAFWGSLTVYFFNFPISFSGHGKPRIRGSACTCYLLSQNSVDTCWLSECGLLDVSEHDGTVGSTVFEKKNYFISSSGHRLFVTSVTVKDFEVVRKSLFFPGLCSLLYTPSVPLQFRS